MIELMVIAWHEYETENYDNCYHKRLEYVLQKMEDAGMLPPEIYMHKDTALRMGYSIPYDQLDKDVIVKNIWEPEDETI